MLLPFALPLLFMKRGREIRGGKRKIKSKKKRKKKVNGGQRKEARAAEPSDARKEKRPPLGK